MTLPISETIRSKPSIADNIAIDVQGRIDTGLYPLGSRLPGRRALASEYGVAPLIIQKAVNQLVAAGLVAAENGRGTFVVRTNPLAPRRLGTVGIVTYVYPSWRGVGVRVEKATMIMQAVERAVSAAGGTSVFCNRYEQDGNHLSLSQAVEEVAEQGAEAVVFVLEQDEEDFERLAREHVPPLDMVAVVWDECPLPVPIVYYDSVDAGRSAAGHLIERGCRRILFFSSGTSTWTERRLQGAREIIRTAGPDYRLDVRIRADRIIPNALVDVDYESEANALSREVLDSAPPFDGVIAANDRMAVQFAAAARSRGLRAGDDYALIGFDNDDEARSAGLTSLQPPWQRMGQEAVHVLERMTAKAGAGENVRFRSQMITRKSSHLKRPKG